MRAETQFPFTSQPTWRVTATASYLAIVATDGDSNHAEITLFGAPSATRAQLEALLAAVAKGIADLAIAEAQKKADAAAGEAEAAAESEAADAPVEEATF